MKDDRLPGEPQTAPAVLMIRPERFAANAETATSNHFQRTTGGGADVALRAARELDGLAVALAAAGVRVHAFAGQRGAALPDEVFPNNWLSLHADGTAVLYPMQAPSRRRERRSDVLAALRDVGYRISRVVDLTKLEESGAFLEGTGSVVLDRTNRVAYACRSSRTHSAALAEFARELSYETVTFDAVDAQRRAIYHTNVLLSIGTRFAAVCTRALGDADRRRVLQRLEASGRVVVDLTFAQLETFAGNLLELSGGGGASVIALSATALGSLSGAQRRALEAQGELVAADVGTIETYGGGSVRCMLAEVALPRARDEMATR